ncbi:MAG: fused MFS/spermidine synthase [Blastocatellia bacterium]|nr:fused MFS/spermidine synthase [Blastocatellia bacterium]
MLSCFLLSGASGLIYEVVWTRMLGLVFGGTTLAISTVLTAFLGGLALGSFWLGKRADTVRDPFRVYGLLEISIGCYGILTPTLFASAGFSAFWKTLVLAVGGGQITSFLIRFLVCSGVLIVPTILMGATLPLLGRYVTANRQSIGIEVGKLYTFNTAGAVIGVWLAGFWLIPEFGVKGTVSLAALVNVGLGALVWLVSRNRLGSHNPQQSEVRSQHVSDSQDSQDSQDSPDSPDASRVKWLLAVYAVSGFSALMLEVAWSRALSLILGSSTYAFTTMLGTFLIGLTLGSLVVTWNLDRIQRPWLVLAGLQLGISALAFATLFWFQELPWWFVRSAGAARHQWVLFQLLRAMIAGAIMLGPTLLLGALFPLLVRLYARREAVGHSVGKLYGFNTLGAIGGSFSTGFFLMPMFGLSRVIWLAAAIQMVLAVWVLGLSSGENSWFRKKGVLVAGVVLGLIFLWGAQPVWNPGLMSAGVSFYLEEFASLTREQFQGRVAPAQNETLYYRDGLSSTVTVQEAQNGNFRILRNNGKVEGLIPTNVRQPAAGLDLTTQTLLGALPVLLHPGTPEDVLVIGHGTGMTAGSALHSAEVKQLKILEIEPEVFAVDHFFVPGNGNPLADPRCQPIADDARNFLMTTDKQYDVLISQPAEPWITGSATLFTIEHWRLARARLRPNGLFCQWVQVYGLPPQENLALIRTFQEVFPHTLIFHPDQTGEILLVGSSLPWLIDVPKFVRRWQEPKLHQALQQINLHQPEQLLAQFVTGPQAMAKLVAKAPLNTDDNALIEFSGPRSLYLSDQDTYLTNFQVLFSAGEQITGYLSIPEQSPINRAEFLARVSLAQEGLVRPAKEKEPVWRVWNEFNRTSARSLATEALERKTSVATTYAFLRTAGEGVPIEKIPYDTLVPTTVDDYCTLLKPPPVAMYNRTPEQEAELCRTATARFPAEAGIWLEAGNNALRRKQFAEASDYLQKALTLDPSQEMTRLGLAQAWFGIGREQEVGGVLKPIQEHHANSSQLQYWLARLALVRTEYGKALQLFEISSKLGPVPGDAYAYKGICAEKLGNKALALQNYGVFLKYSQPSALTEEIRGRVVALGK